MLACPNVGPNFLDAASVLILLTPLSFGLLTIPAYLAVRRLVQTRFAPAFVRGTLERLGILAASLAGACAAVVYADGMAAVASRGSDAAVGGEYLLVFLASVPLGAIPWAAGELASGASERQDLAFLSSVAAASVLKLSAFVLLEPCNFRLPSALVPAVLLQLATTGFAALGAACAYLALRGGTVESAPPEAVAMERVLSDYSSSMSENRSLRGCSSGFF